MITTINLINTSITSPNCNFFFVVRTFKFYCSSNFQVYNTVLLTVVTMMYIRSPEPFHLITILSIFCLLFCYLCIFFSDISSTFSFNMTCTEILSM